MRDEAASRVRGAVPPVMRVRFVTWNINGFAERGLGAFLAEAAWDLCAIQEATTGEALDALAATVGATSYVSVDCRYDSILASREFVVHGAGYEYERSVAVGSDHALVWADLEIGA